MLIYGLESGQILYNISVNFEDTKIVNQILELIKKPNKQFAKLIFLEKLGFKRTSIYPFYIFPIYIYLKGL